MVRFGVDRNAVREAIEVLDVAEVMTGLLARAAARQFRSGVHLSTIRAVTEELSICERGGNMKTCNRARRHFYRALLQVAGNRELSRLFLTVRMDIIHAQYRSPKLQDIRFADYRSICAAVASGDARAAEVAARKHVRRVRDHVRLG